MDPSRYQLAHPNVEKKNKNHYSFLSSFLLKKNMILGSGNFQITGKYYLMQVARHGAAGAFIPLAHVKLLIKS